MKKIAQGVTLLELMIVIAILGILVAIALPSYDSYVERTALAAAKNELVDMVAQINTNKMKNSTQYSINGINSLARARGDFASVKGKYSFEVAVNGADINSYRIFLVPQRTSFKKSLYITASGSIFECTTVGAARSGTGCTKIN